MLAAAPSRQRGLASMRMRGPSSLSSSPLLSCQPRRRNILLHNKLGRTPSLTTPRFQTAASSRSFYTLSQPKQTTTASSSLWARGGSLAGAWVGWSATAAAAAKYDPDRPMSLGMCRDVISWSGLWAVSALSCGLYGQCAVHLANVGLQTRFLTKSVQQRMDKGQLQVRHYWVKEHS